MATELYRLTKYGKGVIPQLDGLIEEVTIDYEVAGERLCLLQPIMPRHPLAPPGERGDVITLEMQAIYLERATEIVHDALGITTKDDG